MAPKRPPKVVGTVMKTRKFVRETVQVAVVESARKPIPGDVDGDEEGFIQIPEPLRAIVVEDKSEEAKQFVQVQVEEKSEDKKQFVQVPVEEKSEEGNQFVRVPAEEKSHEENQPTQAPVEDKSQEGTESVQAPVDDKSPEENQLVQVAEEDRSSQEENLQSDDQVAEEDKSQEEEKPTTTFKKQEEPSTKEGDKRKARTQEGEGKRRKKRRREGSGEEYRRYVFRVLKQVHPGLEVSSKAMTVLNNMMSDMFERMADEASKLCKYTGRITLSSREVQGAVKLVLPGELGKHAIAEGSKAVTAYLSHITSSASKS
ncbi:Histone H2B type 1-A [Morella rubra]|uniref:Histone H2B type 1-A n=1 Tax=Morella rubra TaxID=262757 RepID=A0A6A1WRT3_9ROSI|nr:Histone H2B type 1-A [Morella rubra]